MHRQNQGMGSSSVYPNYRLTEKRSEIFYQNLCRGLRDGTRRKAGVKNPKGVATKQQNPSNRSIVSCSSKKLQRNFITRFIRKRKPSLNVDSIKSAFLKTEEKHRLLLVDHFPISIVNK
jgi:hypothetical protein